MHGLLTVGFWSGCRVHANDASVLLNVLVCAYSTQSLSEPTSIMKTQATVPPTLHKLLLDASIDEALQTAA